MRRSMQLLSMSLALACLRDPVSPIRSEQTEHGHNDARVQAADLPENTTTCATGNVIDIREVRLAPVTYDVPAKLNGVVVSFQDAPNTTLDFGMPQGILVTPIRQVFDLKAGKPHAFTSELTVSRKVRHGDIEVMVQARKAFADGAWGDGWSIRLHATATAVTQEWRTDLPPAVEVKP